MAAGVDWSLEKAGSLDIFVSNVELLLPDGQEPLVNQARGEDVLALLHKSRIKTQIHSQPPKY
jgi:hypothetical protein